MADSDKNILITPNVGTATVFPKIEFTGFDNNTLTLSVLDDGTLSIDGSSGQLFSVADSMTGTIFSVNDVSGIPSIEVIDDGTVIFAEFAGNVGIGIETPTAKFHVVGDAKFEGGAYNINTNTNTNFFEISRDGSSASQVMQIGVSDRTVNFKYIEDTNVEGSGNFGTFKFIVGGNLGETDVTPLYMDHNSFTIGSHLCLTVNSAISAAGTTQGTATALTKTLNRVTVVAASSGVVLPTGIAGMMVMVYNDDGADTLKVYPAVGGTIDGSAINTAVSLGIQSALTFYAITTTLWIPQYGVYA